ncbi:hypothetical protein TNCV_3085421 [Trichonephila clavipes]|nr:hypothetical protein TNCV_3085421 [Trichonephila clavipes]
MVLKSKINNKRENVVYFTFFFDQGENVSQVTEIVISGYGPHTVTVNNVQLCFQQLRSGMTVVENVHKITEMIEADRHVRNRSIAQELKIDRQ